MEDTRRPDPEGGSSEPFLSGAGEMAGLMRAYDWSQTPLGPVAQWPQSLKTALSICLASGYAMYIAWGPQFIQFYNDAYRPILGATKHPKALGQGTPECFAEIWDFIGPMFRRALETGEATTLTDQLLPLDRNGYVEECYFTFSYSAIRDETGSFGGVFVTCIETTDRVLSERRVATLREFATATAEVRTTEHAFQAVEKIVCQNPHDLPFTLLYLLDDEGKTARLVACSGLEPGDAASLPTVSLEGPSVWPFREVKETGAGVLVSDIRERLGTPPGSGWPEPTEAAFVLPLARPGHAQLAGFLVAGLSARLAFEDAYRGFLELLAGSVARVIGNARAYESERQRAEALAELDRAKTTFFSNVSHEFRTPLTLILGQIEGMLARPEADVVPVERESLAAAHRNGLRLLKLVNTLLDFSRIEAGRVRAVYEPTDLSAYTAELASVFRSAVEKAGMRLVVSCPPLSRSVSVDREMWEKIVLNLLSNAFKFTEAGEIEVRLEETGGRAELSVRDTGTGIPAEQLPHIFERFHRVEGTRARTHEGTGIGLALVQELVRLQGGEIRVDSVFGTGTTFTVSLPLGAASLPAETGTTPDARPLRAEAFVEEALRWLPEEALAGEESASVAETESDAESAAAGAAHIVLADDNADMRQYVRRLLTPEYRVTTAADGEEALRAIRETKPDLVLSDVMMPRRDGFGLIQALRSDPETAGVPVILLSARAGEEARIEGLSAGADDYLVKPFTARELLARVASHLKLARLRSELEGIVRESEERFRTLADNMAQFAWMADAAGSRFWYNRRWFDYTGVTPEDMQGWGWRKVHHADYVERVTAKYRAHIEAGEPWEDTFPLRGKDGEYRWFLSRAVPIRDDAGRVVRWFGTNTDITEQRRLQQELQNERTRLAEIFRQAPAFIAVLRGPEHRFEMVNPPYTHLVGNRDVLGKSVREALPDIEGQGFFELLDDVYRTGKPFVGQGVRILLEDKPGAPHRERFLDFVYQPLVEADGSVSGIVALGIDITERRQAEEEALRHQRKIEEMNVRLQRAMTETHHRVKNNLQLVSALIDMQQSGGGESVPMSEFARLGANVRALGVIHDILTQEAKEGSDQETLSCKAVLERLAHVLTQTTGGRPLKYAFEDARLPGRQATTLALVTNELVSNALKHGRGETEVYFRVHGDRAALEVCDDGPGFPEGFSAEVATSTGLELVENITAWDLRGEIRYENRTEGGARVTVTFPLDR